MKALVIYFSGSGHTRAVAERLTRRLKADQLEIRERTRRTGLAGYGRSLVDSMGRRDAEIETPRQDLSSYDLVLIGTPIWAWRLSSPVRAFARSHAATMRRVAFFCTMGSAGAEGAFAELRQLTRRRPAAVLALTEAQVAAIDSVDVQSRLRAFVRAATTGATMPAADLRPRVRRA